MIKLQFPNGLHTFMIVMISEDESLLHMFDRRVQKLAATFFPSYHYAMFCQMNGKDIRGWEFLGVPNTDEADDVILQMSEALAKEFELALEV